ncbi:MAG: hypothetical protein CMM87_07095 [Rickettsiales bacterium]|nr:hypothetical protein [Rickettsiales bacterium]|tara:strand:- start:9157 stop:10263 length:1107 start_codon:yes stop_codon:yes gene_type:complete
MVDIPIPATPYGRLLKCQNKYITQAHNTPNFDTNVVTIARERPDGLSRSYGIVSPEDLCKYLATCEETCLSDPNRAPSMYQVILTTAHTSHRDVWLDIEYYKDKPSPLHAQLKRVQTLNIDRVLRVLDRTPSHVALACATGKTSDGRYKISWHVIVRFDDNGPTYTASDMKRFVLASNARDCDLGVYSKSQCWRLPCCRKASDAHNRVFKIVNPHSNPVCFVRATAERLRQHLVRTVNAPGVARPGRPFLALAPTRPPPRWVQYLMSSGQSPWTDFAPFVRPGAGHWKEQRFYVMVLKTACGMVCPIAGNQRKHKSNNSFIQFDDYTYTTTYRCHSLRCAGKRHSLIMTAEQFNTIIAMEHEPEPSTS